MNRKRFPMTNIGSVSLLMIFIVLCMVTLSALSLSSAAADKNSAERLAVHNTAYYEASAQAETKLKELKSVLSGIWEQSADFTEYENQVRTACENGTLSDGVSLTESDGRLILQFEKSVNEQQSLSVKLELMDPYEDSEADPCFWKVLAWQEISTADWNADNSLTLIQ